MVRGETRTYSFEAITRATGPDPYFVGRVADILVLTGSTKAADVDRVPFRPSRVVDSIADVIALV